MPATASKDAQNVLKHRGRARRKAGVTRLVVELAGLGVQGGSLLDGAEAGDAEGLTGLGDGLSPAADVLVLALAEGVAGFGHDLAVLVLHQARGEGGYRGVLMNTLRSLPPLVFWRVPFQTWRRLPRTRTRRAILVKRDVRAALFPAARKWTNNSQTGSEEGTRRPGEGGGSNHNAPIDPPPRLLGDPATSVSELFGVIRKNWNDTEKISMAPAQG